MKERSTINTLVRQSIEEIMPPGEELNVLGIKEILLRKRGLSYGKDYSEGNLSSALYVLSNAGVLKKTKRGVYQKVGNSSTGESDSGDVRVKCENKSEEQKGQNLTYEVKEVLELYKRNKDRIQEISDEICTALKNVNLCNGATDKEFEALKKMLDFKNAMFEMLEKFEI